MITRTIREALLTDDPRIYGYVYVVRDGDVFFYVGISKDPEYRLAQHVGIADSRNTYTYSPEKFIQGMEKRDPYILDLNNLWCSQVGACIRENAPESLAWSFDIYEKEDAFAVIQRTGLLQTYPHLLKMMEVDWSEQRTIVENALIKEIKPYLNDQLNGHGRDIPARYRRTELEPGATDHLY